MADGVVVQPSNTCLYLHECCGESPTPAVVDRTLAVSDIDSIVFYSGLLGNERYHQAQSLHGSFGSVGLVKSTLAS